MAGWTATDLEIQSSGPKERQAQEAATLQTPEFPPELEWRHITPLHRHHRLRSRVATSPKPEDTPLRPATR